MHLIEQHKVSLSFHGGVSTATLPGLLSYWMKEELLPAMEQVLDELNMKHHCIRINQINIDAGEIYGDDWRSKLTHNICSQFKQQLREAPVMPMPLMEITNNASQQNQTTDSETLVMHYLLHGSLPWWANAAGTNIIQLINELLDQNFFAGEKGRSFLQQHPTALQRLLLQAGNHSITTWFMAQNELLTQTHLPVFITYFKQLWPHSNTALHCAYALLFDMLWPSAHALWKQLLSRQIKAEDWLQNFAHITQNLFSKQLTIEIWKLKTDELILPSPFNSPSEQQQQPDIDTYQENSTNSHAYYVPNAGLVLLHPFLPAFFNNLQLLNEQQQWQSEEAHRRAMLLLHTLIMPAAESIPEYELPLCKLICGWPMHQPVEANIELNENEKQESQALLQHLIDSWTILKSTTVEGLRSSFLQRNGKLSPFENGWRLQVEQQSFDMLLDHLPWTLGVVKTTWMKELLFVDWV